MGNLESSTNRPHLHVLDCERKLEYLDGTHTDTKTTCTSPQRKAQASQSNLVLTIATPNYLFIE